MMSSTPLMDVRHAILVLLNEGPKSGLQLCEELAARAGGVWPMNVDQVYATLRRLERDGLVEPGGACEEPRRKASGEPPRGGGPDSVYGGPGDLPSS